MGLIVSGRGQTKVLLEGQSTEVSQSISVDGGTITNFTEGEIELAAGTAIKTLPQGGITTLTFVQLAMTDKTTGSARSATVTLASTAVVGELTELLLAASENSGITAVKITPQATGNITVVKYLLGGV